MKWTLVLLVALASVALFKAEEVADDVEELANDEESSVSFLYDGSMEDEVMGDEDDPADKGRKKVALRRMGEKRVCGRVFIGCLKKTKARCKLVPVCKVKYFACRCIVRGVRKCKRFLHFVRAIAKKRKQSRKHDEQVAEDEEEDPKRRKPPAFVKICKAGYRKCRRGKKYCGKCLKAFGDCIKKNLKRKRPQKKGDKKADESEEDDETIMADAVENDDDDESEIEEDAIPRPSGRPSGGPQPSGRPKPTGKPNKLIRCARFGVKCMLRARLNCRRQARCVRVLMKCVRWARRRPQPRPTPTRQ